MLVLLPLLKKLLVKSTTLSTYDQLGFPFRGISLLTESIEVSKPFTEA
jgi:hypothetical protein